jgi:hypothetical protein
VLDQAITDGYEDAQIEAERETGLDRSTFPPVCPFTFEQVLSDDFWPD